MTRFAKGQHEFVVVEAIGATAEAVWDLVGGFNNLPAFDPTSRWSILEAGGKDRRIGVTGGGEIVERLIHFDEAARTYSYIITELVGLKFPFENYYSTIVVREGATPRSCVVDWRGWADVRPDCTLDDVERELIGIYRGIADTLKRKFG
ncbi:SRPBCC family protein [Taklimakanibacter deserti]|uniref:SRPBCC family protein n=1 Tax=Taklimakanibacter deserti TaxID=2267839 RepID=UPI000E651655